MHLKFAFAMAAALAACKPTTATAYAHIDQSPTLRRELVRCVASQLAAIERPPHGASSRALFWACSDVQQMAWKRASENGQSPTQRFFALLMQLSAALLPPPQSPAVLANVRAHTWDDPIEFVRVYLRLFRAGALIERYLTPSLAATIAAFRVTLQTTSRKTAYAAAEARLNWALKRADVHRAMCIDVLQPLLARDACADERSVLRRLLVLGCRVSRATLAKIDAFGWRAWMLRNVVPAASASDSNSDAHIIAEDLLFDDAYAPAIERIYGAAAAAMPVDLHRTDCLDAEEAWCSAALLATHRTSSFVQRMPHCAPFLFAHVERVQRALGRLSPVAAQNTLRSCMQAIYAAYADPHLLAAFEAALKTLSPAELAAAAQPAGKQAAGEAAAAASKGPFERVLFAASVVLCAVAAAGIAKSLQRQRRSMR